MTEVSYLAKEQCTMSINEIANLLVKTITRQHAAVIVVAFDASGAPLVEGDTVVHLDTPDVTGVIVAIEDRDTLWSESIYSFSDFETAGVTEVIAVRWSDTDAIEFHGSHLLAALK